jgi:hypothetical protein
MSVASAAAAPAASSAGGAAGAVAAGASENTSVGPAALGGRRGSLEGGGVLLGLSLPLAGGDCVGSRPRESSGEGEASCEGKEVVEGAAPADVRAEGDVVGVGRALAEGAPLPELDAESDGEALPVVETQQEEVVVAVLEKGAVWDGEGEARAVAASLRVKLGHADAEREGSAEAVPGTEALALGVALRAPDVEREGKGERVGKREVEGAPEAVPPPNSGEAVTDTVAPAVGVGLAVAAAEAEAERERPADAVAAPEGESLPEVRGVAVADADAQCVSEAAREALPLALAPLEALRRADGHSLTLGDTDPVELTEKMDGVADADPDIEVEGVGDTLPELVFEAEAEELLDLEHEAL